MTVCVAVRTNDAMVFADDSASTWQGRDASGNSVVLNVYRHGDKLFNLFKGLPIAAMTCGMGNIGDRIIGSLAKEFRNRLVAGNRDWRISPRDYTIEEVARKAEKLLFQERFLALPQPQPTPHHFEFWVGGYAAESEAHDLWRVTIQNGKSQIDQLGPVGLTGIRWGGQPEAITRLLKGFDPNLRAALITHGLKPSDAAAIDTFVKSNFEVRLDAPSMPVQDAIDLAVFLVDTTKGFARFKAGADTVGGDTDVAVVTRHEGYKWIKRKHYYDPQLNPLETDHVGHDLASASRRNSVGSFLSPQAADLSISDAGVWERLRRRDDALRRRRKKH